MPACVKCRRIISAGNAACPACGAPVVAPASAASGRGGATSVARLGKRLALGLAGGGGVVLAYYWFALRPRLAVPEPAKTSRAASAKARAGDIAGADLTVALPGAPVGLAWTGSGFVLGNRDEPWGFLRVDRSGEGFEVRKVTVTEPTYGQAVAFTGVGFDGRQVVGLTTGAWFQEADEPVFTIHDAATLAVSRHVKAPPDAGALAWDGSGWWVGTRKNTQDEPGDALLLRLDESFAVVRTMKAPASGCQGLAWDAARWWWADVFADEILELDVAGDEPVVVSRRPASSYPSGLAWDGQRLWMCEYDKNGLHRLDGGEVDVAASDEPHATSYLSAASGVTPAESDDVAELMATVRAGTFGTEAAAAKLAQLGHRDEVREVLREMLWSDDSLVELRAKSTLQALGLPIDRARDTPMGSPDDGPRDTELLDLKAWMDGDDLHASWSIHVGEELLAGVGGTSDGTVSMPTFARYEITTKGGTLGREILREYTVDSTRSVRGDEILATGLGPGEYSVSVFIHVQTNLPDSGPFIMNDNAGSVTLEH